MSSKKKSDYAPHIPPDRAPRCQMAGCGEPGVYKAPKSREALHDYQWLCLTHIREHNKQWDFFAGLDRDDVEYFIKDAVTGHRPTWSRESRLREHYRQLQDALYEFLHTGAAKTPKPAPHLAPKLRKALAVMELDYPYTPKQLKLRYRVMVKQHHPDMNHGDKRSEERFKQITAAYHMLGEHLKKPVNLSP